jgi:hypothetical protein
MSQLQLNLMGRVDAPSVVPQGAVSKVTTYRGAVRASWANRRSKGMTRQTLAELTGMYAQHVSDYLADSEIDRKGKERRDMPAKYIRDFEVVTGNTFASQWLAQQSGLTVMEGVIAEQKAA